MEREDEPLTGARVASFLLIGVAAALIATAALLFVTWSDSDGLELHPQNRQLASSAFVTVRDGEFVLAGRPYHFAGANFWQGMNMGARGRSGDRARLVAELGRMRRLGITNLRVMASSEGPNSEPYRIAPALMTAPGKYDKRVLDGLDFLLAKMRQNGMRAVLVLNNFWQWSGGMAQYVSWYERSHIPYPNDSGDWNAFGAYSARFYTCAQCQRWYRSHIRMLVGHLNPYTHQEYRNDPTIFSWELANEPRYYPTDWIDGTAAFIKSLDPNHMVTTGSEGAPPGVGDDFVETHDGRNIDYATIHIWPQNWGFFDPADTSSYVGAEKMALGYLSDRASASVKLGKPLVLEEFGLARDWQPLHDIYDPKSKTRFRDRFYRAIFAQIYSSAAAGGPLAGDDFWAWAGKARPGSRWIGDPPHETPGWYSVYGKDRSTLAIISAHARKMDSIG